jgi:hypothetical protein
LWSTRDVAFVIFLALVSFLYSAFVGQLGMLVTGILGFNYLFFWGHAILIGFGLLVYEGRRWRFFSQSFIVALLTLPTFQSGTPFDIFARIPMVVNAFLIDILFNTFYSYFRAKNRLAWWLALTNIVWMLTIPIIFVINMTLFYPPQALTNWLTVFFLLLPLTLIEMVVGAYISYKWYKRLKKDDVL